MFAAGTVISRLFGILRESVLAGTFGASSALDSFLVANRIPNMLRELLAEGALGSSFTKIYTEIQLQDKKRAQQFLSSALQLALIASLIIVIFGVVFAPSLVNSMTFWSATSPRPNGFIDNTISLTRCLFPFIGLMIVSSISSGALHQHGRFFTSAVSPIALNMGYIFGALVLSPIFVNLDIYFLPISGSSGILGLALGVLIGGFMQLLIQIWGLRSNELKISLQKISRCWNKDTKRVLALMGPMIIASGSGQINVLVNTNFATSLATGAVSWLSFSFRLLQLPIGIFAIAISSVALPSLTRTIASAPKNSVSREVNNEVFQSIEWILWLMTPCFCFFTSCSESIIRLIYQHGAFNQIDVTNTSNALFYYAFGLFGYGLIKVTTSFYYASNNTFFAMKVGLFSIFVNYILNLLLVEHFGHIGLAITASGVLSVNALILLIGLTQHNVQLPFNRLLRTLLYLLAAGSISLIAIKLCEQPLTQITQHLPVKPAAIIHLSMGAICTLAAFLAGILLKLRVSPQQGLTMLKK